MGRGKKKDSKKDEPQKEERGEEPPSVSGLSLDEPSTSAAAPAPPPAGDEPEGLTGGGAKKKRQLKKEQKKALAADEPPPAPQPAPAAPTPEPAPAPPAKDEEEELEGLTGGGGKKRRPRKKKSTAPETDEPKTAPGPPLPAAAPAPAPVPAQSAQAVHQAPRGPPPQQRFPAPLAPAYQAQVAPAPAYQPQVAPAYQPQVPPATAYQPKAAPAPAYQPKAAPTPEPQRQGPVKCRFQIPEKIIGKSVRDRPVTVLCNYLPMNIKPVNVYRYDVGYKPDKPRKLIPAAFNTFLQQSFPNQLVAFDQYKNFYSTRPLPKVTADGRFGGDVTVKDPNGKELTFEVTFKATGVIDLRVLIEYMKSGTSLNPPTEAIQCMDVILRQGSLGGYVKAGRCYFRRPENPLRLGDGLEMWTGLFQSAIFTSRPYINIDVAHKGFPIAQPLFRLLEEFRLNAQQSLESQRGPVEQFKNMLKGLKVMAFLGGDAGVKREFICNGVVQPANQQTFLITDPHGRDVSMTVADYFLKIKNIRLKAPQMNCLWLGPREKQIYYPMELCEVAPNQVLNKQLNERQLSTIVKEAATPPDKRKQKIHAIIQAMDYPRNKYFKEFGLEISEQFTQLQAKVLNAPIIKYSDKTAMPKEGVWWSSRMLAGATLERWALIAIERDVRQVNGELLVKMFQEQSRQMGITMGAPAVCKYSVNARELETNLRSAKQANMQLVVVVVPFDRGPRNHYSDIKKAAERTVGMLTQCIKEQTLQRLSPQTAKNILLKINAKLMGVNHALDAGSVPACLRAARVMVVGADVTHPSPDQQSIPSIAAVTASMDQACTKYSIGLSIQTPKLEIIAELEDIMVEHLQTYKKQQGALPAKIFVFRDGVSEGQFAEVLNQELVAVYNAYRRMSGREEKPEVLFLLVQKRHHTRLFVPNSTANVSAGTCVDTDIVHPRELDFYLVSHAAIKGTARPTRYYCIRNDPKMKHDEVEQLTYYLCHLYSRCSRAVSYPTPTYYAHLACERARVLTLGERHNNDELKKKPIRLRVLDNMQQTNPMFFV